MFLRLYRLKYRYITVFILIVIILIIFQSLNRSYQNPHSVSVAQVRAFLAIIILSHVPNQQQRIALRNTWLNLIKDNHEIRYTFVIGSKYITDEQKLLITVESQKYKDVLVLPDVKDSYDFLTSKTLRSFVYINEHWEFKYVIKCDDDSFVKAVDILKELNTKSYNVPNLYWGFFNGAARVKRRGKWKEENWILCDNYLPYALGGGYVLSQRLVQLIANNSAHLKLYKTEDVSVGTWLAPFDVMRQHDTRFDTEYRSRGCSNTYLITHKKSISEMYDHYNQLRATNDLCEKEYKRDLSYIYNWSVPPSKCCNRYNVSIP